MGCEHTHSRALNPIAGTACEPTGLSHLLMRVTDDGDEELEWTRQRMAPSVSWMAHQSLPPQHKVIQRPQTTAFPSALTSHHGHVLLRDDHGVGRVVVEECIGRRRRLVHSVWLFGIGPVALGARITSPSAFHNVHSVCMSTVDMHACV